MERSPRYQNHFIKKLHEIDPYHHICVIFTILIQEKTALLIVADCR